MLGLPMEEVPELGFAVLLSQLQQKSAAQEDSQSLPGVLGTAVSNVAQSPRPVFLNLPSAMIP